MTPKQAKQRNSKRTIFMRKWHRRIGFTASLFIFNLAITGLLLNHYESLSLHTKHLQSSWLLDWYGVKAPQNINCLKSSNHEFCQVDNLIFNAANKDLLITDKGNLINLYLINEELILVTEKNLIIYDQKLQLIDSINFIDELSTNINSSFNFKQQLFLFSDDEIYLYDLIVTEFQLIAEDATSHDFPITSEVYALANVPLKESLGNQYRQQQISILKLVQDLHSGQILSLQGKILTDLVAVIMLVLAITGFISWYRRKQS